MRKKMSKGVKVLGVIIIVASFFNIFATLLLLVENLPTSLDFLGGNWGRFYTTLSLPIGLLYIVFGIGVLRLHDKSRKYLIYLCVLDGLRSIAPTLLTRGLMFVNISPRVVVKISIVDLLFILIVIYFFTRPKVKEQFR